MPISTEGSGMPTTRPKTGSPLKYLNDAESFVNWRWVLLISCVETRLIIVDQGWYNSDKILESLSCNKSTNKKAVLHYLHAVYVDAYLSLWNRN